MEQMSAEQKAEHEFIVRQDALWAVADDLDKTEVSNSFMFRLQLVEECLKTRPEALTAAQKKWMFNSINKLIIESEALRQKNNGLIVELLRTRTERVNISRNRLERGIV